MPCDGAAVIAESPRCGAGSVGGGGVALSLSLTGHRLVSSLCLSLSGADPHGSRSHVGEPRCPRPRAAPPADALECAELRALGSLSLSRFCVCVCEGPREREALRANERFG